MNSRLKWFEIFRASGSDSEGACVRTHSADAAIMRYLDRKTSPDDAKLEPELQKLLTKLYDRQLIEAYDLIDQARDRMNPDGEDRASLTIHKQEFREDYQKQCRDFAAERERYIADHQRAQSLKADMEQARRESLDRSIDPDKPKLTP